MQKLISLDIGTSGAKAALVAQDGRLLASGYASYETHNPADYRVEQEPQAWWRATQEALAQVGARANLAAAADLAGITLSGQMQDLILVGADDTIGRAILYSDTRSRSEAEEISSRIGADRLIRITGNTQDASSLLAKWRWLDIHEPDRLAASRTMLFGAHSYIAWRLCGNASCDHTTASTTGLLDLGSNAWATDLLEMLGLDRQRLPRLTPAGESIGTLSALAARTLMLPPDLPVFTGAGDLAATTVGVGAGEPHRFYCYLGTSGWIASTPPDSAESSWATAESGVFTLRHPDLQRVIRVAPMLTAGGNLDWAGAEIANNEGYASHNATAASAPVGSNGVIYLPYLAGERSPFRDPNARACYIGLSNQTTRADLIRAVMEGVSFAYRSLFELLGANAEKLYVVGGGAKSTLWMQILADVMGHDIEVVAEPENAAVRGAAIIAGRELGWYKTYAPPDHFPVARSYQPQESSAAVYSSRYSIYMDLSLQLRSAFGKISDLGISSPPPA
ncbi:xylulokinase [Rhodococcus xishaensis]|uniref:xylulokinase n=1 Tax=Rhodococcus xishaensis TaxID=2487364 RepID=UPI000FDDBAB9|nr:FGGY family carbohydrate kinase [Rhodococcus xishaensis]